jgi:hypothetical protein
MRNPDELWTTMSKLFEVPPIANLPFVEMTAKSKHKISVSPRLPPITLGNKSESVMLPHDYVDTQQMKNKNMKIQYYLFALMN